MLYKFEGEWTSALGTAFLEEAKWPQNQFQLCHISKATGRYDVNELHNGSSQDARLEDTNRNL